MNELPCSLFNLNKIIFIKLIIYLFCNFLLCLALFFMLFAFFSGKFFFIWLNQFP